MDLDAIQRRLREFAAERDWDQYHSPKNLAMALAVARFFGEESRKAIEDPDKVVQVGDEIADICIYAIRLSDIMGVDLDTAIYRKIDQNIEKYPPDAGRHWSF